MPVLEDLLPSILGAGMGGAGTGPRSSMSSPGLAENELYALALLQNQPEFNPRVDPGPVGQILNAVAPFLVARAQTRQAVAQQGQMEKLMLLKAEMDRLGLEKAREDVKLTQAKTKKAEAEATKTPITPDIKAMDEMAKARGLRSGGVKFDPKTGAIYPTYTTPLAPTGTTGGGAGKNPADNYASIPFRARMDDFNQTGEYEGLGGVPKRAFSGDAAKKAEELLSEARRMTPMLNELRTVVARTPESVGLSGDWKNAVQGFWQQADQFGLKGILDKGYREAQQDKRTGKFADDFEFEKWFNKDVPKAQALISMLSYNLARVTQGAGVLSNQDMENARADIVGAGGSMDLALGGAQSLMANLEVVDSLLSARTSVAGDVLKARDVARWEMGQRQRELGGLPPMPLPNPAGAAVLTTPPPGEPMPSDPLTQYQEQIDKMAGRITPDLDPPTAAHKAFKAAQQILGEGAKRKDLQSLAREIILNSGWTPKKRP